MDFSKYNIGSMLLDRIIYILEMIFNQPITYVIIGIAIIIYIVLSKLREKGLL